MEIRKIHENEKWRGEKNHSRLLDGWMGDPVIGKGPRNTHWKV